MDKSELFSFVKSDSIKNFIKASEVKTNEDIKILQKSGYMIGFTFDKLAEVFPKEIADRLYYNNGFDKTFYFDKENMILGLGVMLAANEVPRIADRFGLDTSSKVNIMSTYYATQAAVRTTQAVMKAVSK